MGGGDREREREGRKVGGEGKGGTKGETFGVCVLDLSTDKELYMWNLKNGIIELIYKINRITVVEKKLLVIKG